VRRGTRLATTVLLSCLAAPARASNLSPSNTVLWTGPGGQGFDDAEGIAVDPTGQFVYIADTYYVFEYDSDGVFVRFWGGQGSGPGQFDHATGITVDPFGDVYVADSGNGRVEHFDENGKFLAEWSIPGAHEVAADKFGTIYVLANVLLSPYPFVTARTSSGAELRTWAAQFPDDFAPGEYYLPHYLNTGTALTTDAAGNVIVVGRSFQRFQQPDDDTCARQVWDPQPQYDHRPLPDPLASGEIVIFSPQGAVQGSGWLSRYPFSCAFSSISDGDARGVAVDPSDGSFFVSLAEHFIRRVPDTPPYLSNDGELDFPCFACISIDMENFLTPHDLTFDCNANLYVTSSDHILKYRNAGAPPPPCGTKRKHFELALGPIVHRPPGMNDKLLVTLACSDQCGGVIKVTAPKPGCKRCRLPVTKEHFHIAGGDAQTIELTLGAKAIALLDHGPVALNLAAHAKPRHGRGRSVVVPETMLLDAPSMTLACPQSATAGTSATASGMLAPAGAPAVDVHVEAPDGTATALSVAAGGDGHFDVPLAPDRVGTWTVRAGWTGDATHDPVSAVCSFAASEAPPVVTVACPAGGTVGSPLAATGSVTPVFSDGQGGIEFTAPSGNVTVVPGGDATGALGASIVPAEGGSWMVRARWISAGNQVTASSPCAVDVQHLPSSLTLTCPSTGPLTFTGTLLPARAGEVVAITYTPSPAVGGPPVLRMATTAADGSFSDMIPVGTPPNSGTAQASWPGDPVYAPATSASCSF
jgi:hypothetical protein